MQLNKSYKNTKELLVDNFEPQKSSLLQALHMIQNINGFISQEDMITLSRYLKVAKSEIFGSITTYPEIQLSIDNDFKECSGLSCFINNKNEITNPTDCKFKCFNAPIGFQSHSTYSIEKKEYKKNNELITPIIDSSEILSRPVLLENINEIKDGTFDSYNKIYQFNALKEALNKSPEEIIRLVEESGLKGRGGAYFPTATKWKMASTKTSIQKYLIVNCEEGEPGVFKDRLIMEHMPFKLIEGALIASYANNCSNLVFYINGEAENGFNSLKNALSQMEKNGIIGKNGKINNSNFKLKIKLESGAGGYVCGEETTLLNTMEGQRREPRLKPPFPTEKGVFSLPTIINNAETLCNITFILNNSINEFKKIGDKDFPGTKLLSISGHFKKSGILEIPMGIKISELFNYTQIEDLENKIEFLAIGGPSSGLLPKSEFHTKLKGGLINENGIMLGAGGFIGINSTIDPIDVVINLAKYNSSESCGKCTPCREGTPRMVKQLEQLKNISVNNNSINDLNLLAETVNVASLCGLGQAAGNPIISYLKYFYNQ
jgi:NADH-quinone oxidoreductase subunit F